MNKVKTRRFFIIISVIILIIISVINFAQQVSFQRISGGAAVLDMRLSYSPEQLTNLFEKIGTKGRIFYVEFLFQDFIFIIFFALVQLFIISSLLEKNKVQAKWQKLKYLPFLRGIFDSLENIFILIILFIYPAFPSCLVITAAVMTALKWITLVLIIAAIIVSSATLIGKTIIKRRNKMKKQIKVIGIISSPRKNGNTATLVREALAGAKEQGAEVMEIFLKNYQIEFCRGCLSCLDRGVCVISDDMDKLKKLISEADGIIIGSPNYANSHNAIMKQFLERLGLFEFLTSSLLGGKYFAGIATAGGKGAKKVAKGLAKLFRDGIFSRGYVSGILGIGMQGKQVSEIPYAMHKANLLGKKIALDIRYNRKYPLQNILGRGIINLIIKPNFKKFIIKSRKTITRAVYQNLKLRELI